MEEVVAIVIFILLMMGIQIAKLRKIVIYAKFNYIKMIMSVVISSGIIIFFWTDNIVRLIELIAVAILVLFVGIIPEGLGKKQVIKFGIIDGKFNIYKSIELRPLKDQKYTRIDFLMKSNRCTSIIVKDNIMNIKRFFQRNNQIRNKIVVK
ncbi:hypothetical protein J2Z60_001680 [Lactobacillus colini]|uniref:DUF5673 domain-containing protein n=1 Tax=Lactobacillus colini TaxID=1819254 RepID=A0ABS4MFN1_9LACO|nr:hypothetical protein [Lactobacillus colini]MBP2058495.1 hypothetical protein [Lactobacillus colini]